MIKNSLILMLAMACTNAPSLGDHKLSPSEVPSFLKHYQNGKYEDLEIFAKRKPQINFYEVKYEENDEEVSISFDESGKQIEKETDIDFKNLSYELQLKIKSYLNKEYPDAKILEVEKREDKEEAQFIDVEIRHPSSKSGYWELSFDRNGNYVSREVEDHDQIETLN